MTTTTVEDVVAKVDESITKATTAKEITQELLLVSSPLTQCQDLLIPAPLAITLTAKLILISNNNDFNLTKKEGGYKYLHWSSFRAAFAEIAHGLQAAFRVANTNTLEISMRANDIPTEFNRAVVILKKAPANEVSNLLKIPLENIQSANDACLQLAKEVENNFILITHMTEELLEATLNKEKETQASLKEIEKRRQGMLEAEKLAETRKKENEIRLKELEKKVEDADTLVKGTFDDSDNFILKTMLVENITQVIKTSITAAAPLFASCPTAAVVSMAASTAPCVVNAVSKIKETNSDQVENNVASDQFETTVGGAEDNLRQSSKICAFSKAEYILEYAQNLLQFINDEDTIGDDVLNAQNDQSYQEVYQEMKRSLSEPSRHSKNARHALDLCAKGWDICRKINVIRQNPGKLNVIEVVDDIKKLHKECKKFASKAQFKLGGDSGLNKVAVKQVRSKTKKGGESVYINHTHFKLERSLQYLNAKQEQFDKAQEERKQLLDEMAQQTEQIRNLSIDEVDYTNVRKCLTDGIRVLGNLRTQWEYLVQYFLNMSTLISMALNTSKKFQRYAESAEKSKFLREFVYEEAFSAVKQAVVVRQLSKTYREISETYLMPQVGAIDQFFIGGDRDNQRIADEQLRQYQLDAEDGIRSIIENNIADLSNAMNTRKMQLLVIKNSVETHMSEKDVQENKECIRSGASFMERDEDDLTV